MLTSMFEEIRIPLQKRVGFQVSDEIRRNTLVRCGFTVIKGSSAGSEQGPQTPFGLVPRSASLSSVHAIDTSVQDQFFGREKFLQ